MRVLLLEDEPGLGNALREHVAAAGHAVDWFSRIDDARDALATVEYELVLLDLHLPDGLGLDLLREMRRRGSKVPVIILTARDRVSDRIEGLNAGADDYLVKPFDLDELAARVAAVARRYGGNPNPVFRLDRIEIDIADRKTLVDGRAVELTGREWAILDRLLRRPGSVVAKSSLEDAISAFGSEVESNAVEVHISRLRKKLGHDLIRTLRGQGYRVGE